MKTPHRTPRHPIAVMTAIGCACACTSALALAPAHAAPRGCDAAWGEPGVLRLVRLDATSAALSAGPLVIARAAFAPQPVLLQALQPQTAVAASLGRAAAEGRWRVAGPIAFDEECTLEVDTEVALEAPSPPIARSAQALALLGTARRAMDDAQTERAAELAQAALDALGDVSAQPVAGATIAAFAIERLIEQRQLGRAGALAQVARTQWQGRLDPAQPAALRFELAAARLLAWPEALAAREALQPQVEATFGARSQPALENRVRLANTLAVLGRGETALAAYDAIETIVRDDPRPAAALRILLARGHANALSLQGRPDAQIVRLQALRAELIPRYGAQDRRVIDVDDDIARGLAEAERLNEALAGAARVFLWRDRELGPAHSRTLESARLLALLYGRSGRYATARTLLEDLLQRIDPQADMGLTIRVWRDIATWAALDGEPLAALDLMGRAFRAARAHFSPDSAFAIGLAIDYGWLLVRAGDTAAGCALLDGVRAHAPAANGLREWADAGFARCLLAPVQVDAATLQQAIDLLRSAHAAAVAEVGADNSRALIWQALLAGAELRAGQRAAAKQRLVEFVFRAERNRAAFANGSALRDSTFGMWIAENDSMAGYRTLALLHAQDGDLDEALRMTELARDRQLRDRFAERRWVRARADTPAGASLRALQARRQRLDEAIAVAGVASRVRLEAERVAVTGSIDSLERELVARFPDAASAVAPTVAAIQARLPADTAVVAYQRAGAAWWITRIDARSARLLPVRDTVNIAVAARAWARAVRGEPVRVWERADGQWTLGFVRPATAVARVPIARVAAHLGTVLLGALELDERIRRLVVVADDELIGLPLDALAQSAGGAPAVMRYEFMYAASLGGWLELRDRTRTAGWSRDLLAVGPGEALAETDAKAAAGKGAGAPALRETWAPLPFARREAEGIARHFPRGRTRVLLEHAASKATILAANRSGELARYRYVHFATHASVEPEFAERAALILAGDAGPAALTATEFAGLALDAELVVLSACDSGVGRYEQGQGPLGFAFAALAAGSRGAVLSLWPVDDETTAAFMARFYARLRAGAPPAAALAATKREFARSNDRRRNDPRVWSAFVLFGSS